MFKIQSLNIIVDRLPNANGKQFFNVKDKILRRNIALPLPTRVSMECLSRLFSTFFHDKVDKIREYLDSGTTTYELPSPYSHDVEYQHTPFTSFETVTTETPTFNPY